jgi:hypothetical protein
MRSPGHRSARAWLAVLGTLVIGGVPVMAAQEPTVSPAVLVRETVENELKPASGPNFLFRDTKRTPHGSQTKLMVETKDAMAGMLIEINGKPLTPRQRQDEAARLHRLVTDPDALKHKQKQEKEDQDRVTRIMKALPDAFLYEPDGTTVGTATMGRPGDELVRLKFRPNPKYNPPSRTEQVLQGMQGIVLIDANRHRIAQIDGTLFKDVNFGWGILGHLDKGGHFEVEQADVGDNAWEICHMALSFTGKILLFKSLNIQSDEIASDFQVAPSNLTFAEGVELLKRQEAETAESRPQESNQK